MCVQVKADPTKFSGKKSKAAAKKGPGSYQYEILQKSGIPEADIPQFRYAQGGGDGGQGALGGWSGRRGTPNRWTASSFHFNQLLNPWQSPPHCSPLRPTPAPFLLHLPCPCITPALPLPFPSPTSPPPRCPPWTFHLTPHIP